MDFHIHTYIHTRTHTLKHVCIYMCMYIYFFYILKYSISVLPDAGHLYNKLTKKKTRSYFGDVVSISKGKRLSWCPTKLLITCSIAEQWSSWSIFKTDFWPLHTDEGTDCFKTKKCPFFFFKWEKKWIKYSAAHSPKDWSSILPLETQNCIAIYCMLYSKQSMYWQNQYFDV